MIHRRTALAALGALAAAGYVGANPASATAAGDSAQPIDFVALGDMPYGPDLLSGPPYRHLVNEINALGLPFAIHVGDFKSGTAACSDAEYERQYRHFQRFARALVYTPGDNDWLDCQRQGDASLERLQALRQRFFAAARSLGQQPLALQRQGDLMAAYRRYVENQRWVHRDVVFATFHTVGPDNGMGATQADVRAEAQARELANAAWIREAFALASQLPARALVLATQAEVLGPLLPHSPGLPRATQVKDSFAISIRQTLLPLAEAAGFPVLFIHGDLHNFTVDQPFRNPRSELIRNLWRLQVYGEPRLHAVRVRIQPAGSHPPFAFTPIWNPMSTDPRSRPRPPR